MFALDTVIFRVMLLCPEVTAQFYYFYLFSKSTERWESLHRHKRISHLLVCTVCNLTIYISRNLSSSIPRVLYTYYKYALPSSRPRASHLASGPRTGLTWPAPPGQRAAGRGRARGLGPACATRGVCPRVQGHGLTAWSPSGFPTSRSDLALCCSPQRSPCFMKRGKYSSWVCSGQLRGCLLPVPQGPARPPGAPLPWAPRSAQGPSPCHVAPR